MQLQADVRAILARSEHRTKRLKSNCKDNNNTSYTNIMKNRNKLSENLLKHHNPKHWDKKMPAEYKAKHR